MVKYPGNVVEMGLWNLGLSLGAKIFLIKNIKYIQIIFS
jgi:hypothetical protein